MIPPALRPLFCVPLLALLSARAPAAPGTWRHSGRIWILTTPEGAALPAGEEVRDFPLLVRLTGDTFDFAAAQPRGEDIRFTAADGTPLAFEIEAWDAGTAAVWVRIPRIQGHARQEIRMLWGNPEAVSESHPAAVFNASNGYLSVWHMTSPVQDATGRLTTGEDRTTEVPGVAGPARQFAEGRGIFGGDHITGYPEGAAPHSSEAWFRPEKAGGTILGWGNEAAQGKSVMQLPGPAHVRMDCYFSGGNIEDPRRIPMGEWVHAVHTYEKGTAQLFVNGVAAGPQHGGPDMALKSPAQLWIGGWHGQYSFTGAIDEVRVSSVARSAAWVRLQYENQKPLASLPGLIEPPGKAFSVHPQQLTVPEGGRATVTAEAGGAQKLVWSLQDGEKETLLAADRLAFSFEPGRITGDRTLQLQLKAVFPDAVKTLHIPVTIRESIPDPVFSLKAPAAWDGRSLLEIPAVMEQPAKDAPEVRLTWSVDGVAAGYDILPGKLRLTRAHLSGPLTVTATADNGGRPVTQSVTLTVTEPAPGPWIPHRAGPDERPRDQQFYARDDRNQGTLHWNGRLETDMEKVTLRVYAGDRLHQSVTARPDAARRFTLSAALQPGLILYRAVLTGTAGGREEDLGSASGLVCGDAYLISGQSNAVATDWGKEDPGFHSGWIRTWGTMSGNPESVTSWGEAVHRSHEDGKFQIGYWGMELARRLVEAHRIPVCILNGAAGGTRIDQHQRDPSHPEDRSTLYGRLLWRVRQAGLTCGIRGVLWHQGENDQGADGPGGGFGCETWRTDFIRLASAWKEDYPNLQHYYVFQIWPRACAMGIDGSDNRLREVQRTLPAAFSNLSVMSTLGIDPPGGCHFPAAGYAAFARLMAPLVERDHYGVVPAVSITPPNLRRAWFPETARDRLCLEFDQPVVWQESLCSQFSLDGSAGSVTAGSVSGRVLTLTLNATAAASRITYLDSKSWSPENLLRGANGIAALTFCDVPLEPPPPDSPGR